MALTSGQLDVPGLLRGEDAKVIAFGNEAWVEAQQKESQLAMKVTEKSLAGFSEKLFDKVEKVNFTVAKPGVQLTPVTSYGSIRRKLSTSMYEHATQIDRSDEIDTSISLMNINREQLVYGLARLKDEVILHSIIAPTQNTTANTADSTSHVINASITVATGYKDIMFAKTQSANPAKDAALEDFAVTDLEDVKKIFSDREVAYNNICCTLTPEVERLLGKDVIFSNALNVYSISSATASDLQAGFTHRGIRFIQCFNDRLPLIVNTNVGLTAPSGVTRTSKVTLACRDVTVGGGGETSDKRGLSAVAARVVKTNEVIETTAHNVIYFWSPQALYFAKRDANTFNRNSYREDFRGAKQFYARVDLGALLIDDDYAIGLVISGTRKHI